MTDGVCVKNTSILSRSALAGAVALSVLVGGAVIPAASATTALAAPVATSVVAAKKAKKPQRVTGVKLAKGGSRNHNVRVGWTWQQGVKRYEVQVATDKAFKKNKVTTVRAIGISKGSSGMFGAQERGTVPVAMPSARGRPARVMSAMLQRPSLMACAAWPTCMT